MDRFNQGYTPIVDHEAGTCAGCGGVMYHYELRQCECGASVHQGCLEQCEICGIDGCRSCFTRDDDTLQWLCEECRKENDHDH